MTSWFRQVRPLLAAGGIALAFGACDEKLDAGIACPALCPHQQVTIRDTTFFPVELDTAIAGFPQQGAEEIFFVASMVDTIQTVAIVRYDSLPTHFRYNPSAPDSLIYAVDSAHIRLTFVAGDTLAAPTTIEIYDVDLEGPDDDDPNLPAVAFTPDRLLGTRTVPADSLRDTVSIPVSNAKVLEKIQATQNTLPNHRFRIGVRVSPTGTNHATFLSSDNLGSEPVLVFRPHFDPAVNKLTVEPLSETPSNPFTRIAMRDYLIVTESPLAAPPDVIRVGGIPGHRAYLRFDIPRWLTDSVNVIRATLELTQRPNPDSPQPFDTIAVSEFRVASSPVITDITRALLFAQRFRDLDSIAVAPADDGVREFELIQLMRFWRGTTPERTPRTLALATESEGALPGTIDFFSMEAPPALRPRLKIFYLPLAGGGLP